MVKCANCGCLNVKGSKECSNCRCILLRGGISFQPAIFSRKDKFILTMGGLVFLVVGLFILGRYIYYFIDEFTNPLSITTVVFSLIFGLVSVLLPCIICFGVAYFLYFCVKNGKNKEDINNDIDNNINNKPL